VTLPSEVRAYDTVTLDSRLNHVAVIGDSYTTHILNALGSIIPGA